MKILIVEDDASLRRLLEMILDNWEYDVTCAEDGSKAWEIFCASEFDVVITDWMMPITNGIELCHMIRSQDRQRHRYVYIIILTVLDRKENLLGSMEAGADDYITKPIDRIELQFRLKVAERIVNMSKRISRLEGILPICSYCKKIRQEKDLWEEIEKYVSEHSEAAFSHSICPECYSKHVNPQLKALKSRLKK